MQFRFSKYRKVYFIFSGILIIGSIVSLLIFGLKFGIEFTGGSLMEAEFTGDRPSIEVIQNNLSEFNLGDVTLQPVGQKGMLFRMKTIDGTTHEKILSKLQSVSPFEEKSFQLIGPAIGKELRQKTELAVILALIAITLYISFAFRKVSRPVSSWQYGIASLIGLFHNILIPLGVFSLLGKFYNVEITIPIVAALLTILGYSVHDTIVIFDRIRENILKRGSTSFEETVDWSLNQTLGRSINTVLTVLIVLFTIFFFGGLSLKYFSLILIIGITCGAYSSIFIASPILVTWLNLKQRKKG
ncbi:MAG: protein translocase subunit SecF [Candidatus Paceibacterota bacterium]